VSLILPGVTWAQDEKDADAKSKVDAKAEEKQNLDGEVEIGIEHLDVDSYRYGKYTGRTDEGAMPRLNFKLEKRPEWDDDDTTRWRLQGWNVGIDSRRLEFDFNQQGKQHFNFDYRQIPNNRYSNGMTPYLGAGSGDLTLPDNWWVIPDSSTTSAFLNLEENLRILEVDTERKTMLLKYDRKLGDNWNMSIDYRHDVKDGVRSTGGVIGYSGGNGRSALIPAPVDWNTDNISAMFDYTAGRAQFGLGIYASFFKNDESRLIWQNAFGQHVGWEDGVGYPNGQGQMAMEPDNSYLQFKAYGGMNFNAKTRLTADFSYGKMEQDDAFLPFSINPALNAPIPLPQANADAEINMTMFNLRLTSQFAPRWNLAVNYRYDDRDNKTPRAVYVNISGDSQNQKKLDQGRINLPYSYTEHKADAIVKWRVARGISIKGGVVFKDLSRSWTEVSDSEEFGYLAGIRFASWQTASLSLDYRREDRDVSEYIGNVPYQESHIPGVLDPNAWENHPWMRKYNLADREREELRFRADWFPTPMVNFGLSGSQFQDDYTENLFGLNESEVSSWTIDAGFYPTSNIVLTGYYSTETWDAEQANRSFRGADPQEPWDTSRNWWADTEDEVDTWNLHLAFNDLGKSGAFTFGFDYTYSNAESLINVTGAASIETAPLPKLVSKLRSFGAFAEFGINEKNSIALTAESSEYKQDDFALDNVVPDTMLDVLNLGQTTGDYDIVLLTASWKYRF
jgi:MtrB/PioB family decaheme-associated outer membrane protein